jgi:outer membrane protein
VRRYQTRVAAPNGRVPRLGRAVVVIAILAVIGRLGAQSSPGSPGQPWHPLQERQVTEAATRYRPQALPLEADKVYSLPELIDLAEAYNPETRSAWEGARVQAAALGIARSELLPLITAVSLVGVNRQEAALGTQFYRQTIPDFQVALDLTYTIFDFGARHGRINVSFRQACVAGPV